MISCVCLWLFIACWCSITVALRVKRHGLSSKHVTHALKMVELNEPLSTYSLSSHPFTMGGKAVTIVSARSTMDTPSLRIFRDPDGQVDSLRLPTSAYEIPILPDEEPMVLHTKRLQFAYSMVSRMVVGDLSSKANNKLIKAHVDRETGKMASVGVLCEMVESRRFQSGEIAYVLQGLRRVNLLAFKQRRPYLTAMVSDLDTTPQQAVRPGQALPAPTDKEEAGLLNDRVSYSDVLACEELCEDIYRDLSTVLRLYKLLNRREPGPAPGFQLFADDSTAFSSVSDAPSQPVGKSLSVVADLLKMRTGTPGVELPIEIFRNRPVAALEYTRDELAEMYQHGEELLAQLAMLPQPADAVESLVPSRAPPVSVRRVYSANDVPVLASNAAKPSSLRLTRLRMLAAAALEHTANMLRLPERGLSMLFKAALRRLSRAQSPSTKQLGNDAQTAGVEPGRANKSVGSALGLTVKADSHLGAMVQRMSAEVRATQDGMRHRLSAMTAEVESFSAMLQFVEDRASAEQQAERESLSEDAAPAVHAGGDHIAEHSSGYHGASDGLTGVDVTPLLRRHEVFSHAMCLPTASRDPQLLQRCIEMDTLTRLRTVASALSADKEHLIQHALAEALLQQSDVHELEGVDLGNDLDVRCYHEVNISQAVFVGFEDMQAVDTITSVAASRAQQLLQDDRAVQLSKQVPVTLSSSEVASEPQSSSTSKDLLLLDRSGTAEVIVPLALSGESVNVNNVNANSVNVAQHVEAGSEAVQDVNSSFFEVDGRFLQ